MKHAFLTEMAFSRELPEHGLRRGEGVRLNNELCPGGCEGLLVEVCNSFGGYDRSDHRDEAPVECWKASGGWALKSVWCACLRKHLVTTLGLSASIRADWVSRCLNCSTLNGSMNRHNQRLSSYRSHDWLAKVMADISG